MKVKTIVVKLETEIHQHEVPLFRGAVNAILDKDHSILFHNHTDNGLRYSYPLIQYKRIGGKAAIVCLGDGADTIYQFFSAEKGNAMLGDRIVDLNAEKIMVDNYTAQIWQNLFKFRIRNWLPLNSKNYGEYKALNTQTQRIVFLEKILTGNILSFLKGIGERIDDQLECKILKIEEPRLLRYKGVKMMSFDVEFLTNISLPQYIGLGKDASQGYGVVTKVIKQKTETDD